MKDYVKFISSLILFGSNGVMTAQILLPSCNIVVLRTLIGALFLGSVFALKRPCANIKGARDMLFVVASGVSMGLSWLFLYEAYQTVGVAVSSLAYYCAPIMVMALSPMIFKERLTGRLVVSFCIVFAGAVLLNGASDSGGGSAPWGLFCGWASAVCHAAMVIFSKKADKVDGLASSLVQLVASFAVATAFLGEPLSHLQALGGLLIVGGPWRDRRSKSGPSRRKCPNERIPLLLVAACESATSPLSPFPPPSRAA